MKRIILGTLSLACCIVAFAVFFYSNAFELLFLLGLLTVVFGLLANTDVKESEEFEKISRGRFEKKLLGSNQYGKYYCKANGLYYGLAVNGDEYELDRFKTKQECLDWLEKERIVIKYE